MTKSLFFVNIYAPNDQTQQVHSLRDLSHSVLNSYANKTLVLGGDFTSNISLETKNSVHFFDSPNLKTLNNEEAERCKGLLTIKKCADALNKFQNNKTHGSDGLTIEFYRLFWDAIGHFMVDSSV